MSESKQTPKNHSWFIDSDQLEGDLVPFARPSEEALGLQNGYEEHLKEASDRTSSHGSRPGPNLQAVLPQASSMPGTFPSLSPTHSALYTLPPISLPSPRRSSYQSHHVGGAIDRGLDDMTSQAMQREHSTLVSAYSSAQIRVTDLDEAVQASKMELAKLAKDRQLLKAKMDDLEAENDELRQRMEVSQQHTTAKDAQYSYILEMSSRLQSQSASESQQRKVEQERWVSDERAMQDTIRKLQSELRDLQERSSNPMTSNKGRLVQASETNSQVTPILTDHVSLEQHSRSSECFNAGAEAVLLNVMDEHAQLNEHIEKLGRIARSIQSQLHRFGTLDSGPRSEGT